MADKSFTCVETCRFLGVVPHAGVGLQKVVVFPPPPHRFATHKQTTTPHHSNFHHGPTRRHQPSIHTGGSARGAQPRNNRRAGHGVSIRPFPKLSTFPRLANPADESRRDKLQDFLLEVQSFPRWSDGLACFSCTKVLPRDSFANPQTKMERGRYGTAEGQAHRFCILCGMNKGKYNPGDLVVQGENVRFICHHCKILRDGRFCKLRAICSHCDRRGVLLERCKGAENHEGHEVIGKMLGSELLVLINSILRFAKFQGQSTSL